MKLLDKISELKYKYKREMQGCDSIRGVEIMKDLDEPEKKQEKLLINIHGRK